MFLSDFYALCLRRRAEVGVGGGERVATVRRCRRSGHTGGGGYRNKSFASITDWLSITLFFFVLFVLVGSSYVQGRYCQQCDQIAGLFAQYLAILNIEKFAQQNTKFAKVN